MSHNRPVGITIVAALMIVFGLAEVVTGFPHNFLGLVATADAPLATYAAVGIGGFYAAGGFLLLRTQKWAARLAMVSLIGVITGRITMVLAGLYPMASFLQSFSIVTGTAIAIFFGIYIGSKWSCFQ
ncbi:MAG: hypothetical protein WBX25_35005 [Rhodomicrobium sp.]